MTLVVVELVAGVGAAAPVVSMCPANAETASVRLRIVAAHIRRKVFTLGCLLREMKKFFIKLVECNFSCKSWVDCVRFAGSSFLAFSVKSSSS